MEIRSNSPVAVVGAGTMGVGIAQVAAAAGHPVIVLDTSEAALSRGREGLRNSLEGALARGRIDGAARDGIESRLSWSTDLALASQATLVIEAVVESMEVKRRLFGGLARVVRADAVLASNTSSLSIGGIAEQLLRRGRFLGLHFFNPVPAMRLVEIVAGPETDEATVDACAALMRRWGKHPVRVRDVPGFIVNRVARPYYAEAFAALGEGVAPEVIDAAMVECAGFRMGPLALADLIGHDVNYAVATAVHEAGVGTPRFRPQESQRRLVESGRLGRKVGLGVFDHDAATPRPRYVEPGPRVARIAVSAAGMLQPLVDAASEAGVTVVVDPDVPSGTIDLHGVRVGLGDGRRLAERPDVDVLLDHVRDFTAARTFVITASTSEHAGSAAAFLAVAGRRAILVGDRPGQLVLRTLAQIANAAADAVADGVASADDVEIAMLHGANHPEGPLAWVGRLGASRVAAVLGRIEVATRDAMYQPSRWFGGR